MYVARRDADAAVCTSATQESTCGKPALGSETFPVSQQFYFKLSNITGATAAGHRHEECEQPDRAETCEEKVSLRVE